MLINPHQMTKADMTLLFHDKKVYMFLMVWVDFCSRPGRKLQLPFMRRLAPLPGRTASFPAPLISPGTGPTALGDQTERCGSARGNAEGRLRAAHVPSPAGPGTPPQGGDRTLSLSRRAERGSRREAESGQGAGSAAGCTAAPHAPGTGGTSRGETLQSFSPCGDTGETPVIPGGAATRPQDLSAPAPAGDRPGEPDRSRAEA